MGGERGYLDVCEPAFISISSKCRRSQHQRGSPRRSQHLPNTIKRFIAQVWYIEHIRGLKSNFLKNDILPHLFYSSASVAFPSSTQIKCLNVFVLNGGVDAFNKASCCYLAKSDAAFLISCVVMTLPPHLWWLRRALWSSLHQRTPSAPHSAAPPSLHPASTTHTSTTVIAFTHSSTGQVTALVGQDNTSVQR